MARKYQREARKKWISTLNSIYGKVAPENVSYVDCAKLISFFSNQIFDVDSIPEETRKGFAAEFVWQSSTGIEAKQIRFVA